MNGLIEHQQNAIRALCRTYGVRQLDLFGSAATGAFAEATSDLDFVVTFAATRSPGYADRYLGFAEALETLFGRPVDVITERSIRNPFFRQAVEASRRPIYDERDYRADAGRTDRVLLPNDRPVPSSNSLFLTVFKPPRRTRGSAGRAFGDASPSVIPPFAICRSSAWARPER